MHPTYQTVHPETLRLYQLDCQRRMPVWHPCRRVFTANRWKKTCFHFRGVFVGLVFLDFKSLSTLILLILEANKVLCGRCGMWNTMGPATKFNFQEFASNSRNRLAIVSWILSHVIPFFGGGKSFLSPRIGCLVSFPAVSNGPKGDRTHSIRVGKQNQFTMSFTTDVFLEMVVKHSNTEYAIWALFNYPPPSSGRATQTRKESRTSQGHVQTEAHVIFFRWVVQPPTRSYILYTSIAA